MRALREQNISHWFGIVIAHIVALTPRGVLAGGNPFIDAATIFRSTRDNAGVGGSSLETIIGKVIQGALSLVGVIFLVLAVYAGYKWMTAQGDVDKITKAKDTLTAAIIGLAITLAAYAITAFVISKFIESGIITQ